MLFRIAKAAALEPKRDEFRGSALFILPGKQLVQGFPDPFLRNAFSFQLDPKTQRTPPASGDSIPGPLPRKGPVVDVSVFFEPLEGLTDDRIGIVLLAQPAFDFDAASRAAG